MQYQSFPVSYLIWASSGGTGKKTSEKMAHVGAPRNSEKRKHESFKCEIPIFKPSPKG